MANGLKLTASSEQHMRPVVFVAIVGIGLLSLAILGHPPYWYFFLLKTYVVLGSIFGAYALWKTAPATAPIGLLLLGTAGVNAFAKMRRKEWFTFDLLAVVLFAVTALLAVRITRAGRGSNS